MEEETEDIKVQEYNFTAYDQMSDSIEQCAEWLDIFHINYVDIIKFDTFRNEIVSLANKGALPEVTIDWIIQRIKISDRFANSNYSELLSSKKEITFDEYCDLEKSINKGANGVTLKELTVLTNKEEETIRNFLFAECYLTIADHNPHQLLMGTDLDMYLIPIVNEKNQLTGEFRIKYLFTSEAISILAENMDEYGLLY